MALIYPDKIAGFDHFHHGTTGGNTHSKLVDIITCRPILRIDLGGRFIQNLVSSNKVSNILLTHPLSIRYEMPKYFVNTILL